MQLQRSWAIVRDSLWFVPAIWVVGSAVLAFALIAVDRATPDFARQFPLVFGGGADGARGLLSSIAGSMITVAGVTFSITIVALQLASTQFAPRVLRTFMRDRASQVVLGSFIGAFTYAILVLRSIRSPLDGGSAFVPSLSISVGILFALIAVGMLVYFLHHIATRIQVTTIVGSVADEATRQISADWPAEADGAADPTPDGEPAIIAARRSGNLQLLDVPGLLRVAARRDLVVHLLITPGDWVQQDAPLFGVWPASATDEETAAALNDQITVGAQRSIEQDPAFGIRQLVDVAVKAISPGINDPTSATDCIDRLGQILVAAGRRHAPYRSHRDERGVVRVWVPYRDWDELVQLSFDQLRQYGARNVDISIALATVLRTIVTAVPSTRHAALRQQAGLIGEAADTIGLGHDRARVRAAVDRVLSM